MATSVIWLRRDLRLADDPALVEAIRAAVDVVVPLLVFDRRLWGLCPAPDIHQRRDPSVDHAEERAEALPGGYERIRNR